MQACQKHDFFNKMDNLNHYTLYPLPLFMAIENETSDEYIEQIVEKLEISAEAAYW